MGPFVGKPTCSWSIFRTNGPLWRDAVAARPADARVVT